MKGMSETVSTASNAADAWTNPLRDPRDLRLPRIAGPCSIVIFGVTGDLSRKKLLPAIYDLANRGLLPPSFGLTGFARRDWTEDHFKDFVKENVQAHCRTPFKESTWKQLAAGIRFVQGTFDDPKAFERLSDTVAELDRDRGTRGNHAFYMSVPPRAFPQVSRQLADCGLAKSDKGAWRRVIIEKPFGHDLASAKELDRVVSEVFDPSSVFRIDHYLGKETVQNMLALRFANAMYEPIWNANYVDHVQITMAEDIGIGGRAGYYDGIGLDSSRASTFEVAQRTESPVVLVLNAKGAGLSALAVLDGFLHFAPENRIRGVILNGCTAMSYRTLARAIEERFSVRACGFLPQMPDCSLESRHLVLITAAEVDDLKEKMQRLAAKARETIDLDALLQIAKSAPPLTFTPPDIPVAGEHVRIGVARDRAFCFYYEDSLELLRRLGAELVPFSPLSDERLPEDLHGLYLGGGYPELYAERLEANAAIRASIRAAVERGLPCVAECGGFMYLTQSIAGHAMAGVLSGSCFDAGKLTRFGYATLTAQRDSMLFAAGEQIPAHEFHRWDAENPGEDFLAEKPSGRSWRCAYAGETLYAGYPHFHFYANLSAAVRFVEACRKEKHRYE